MFGSTASPFRVTPLAACVVLSSAIGVAAPTDQASPGGYRLEDPLVYGEGFDAVRGIEFDRLETIIRRLKA